MSSCVYISGLPGIGKTTAVEHLVSMRPDQYLRLSFGELLRGVTAPQTSHESFRADAASTVDRRFIEEATVAGAELIRKQHGKVVLMDSHAVTPLAEGIRATPDTPERVLRFGYGVIVHLDAASAESRIVENSGREGRRVMTPSEVASAEAIQLSVVTGYASICDCPLYVVSARGASPEIAERLDTAIEAGMGWTPPKAGEESDRAGPD